MTDEQKSEAAKREEEVLAFWREDKTFEKSLAKDAPKGEFVFYDGPPFATGLPHTGSLLASVIKDVIPRYKTMRGYRVPRVWGWDCHGLPIENLVEKKLGLKNKKEIENIGIATFNEEARASVLEFADEWEKYVERVGRWVDFKESYKTMDNSYMEAVWEALKRLHEKGLMYEGRKVLMYCPHCETPLAKAEIAQDNTYKDVTEEAVTVKFKVKNPSRHGLSENTYLLAWTTTPWTLPGNVALAVGKDLDYLVWSPQEGNEKKEVYISATPLFQAGRGVPETKLLSQLEGDKLVGLEYEPLFTVPALTTEKSYRAYAADFVNTEEGTGIVHTAVMYGEDDFTLGQKEGLPMVQMLNPNGTYNDEAPEFLRGQYIKKAEKDIKEDLEKRGLLFEKKNHTHSYPHCYRCGTPLIYNAVASWFLNIQAIKETMLSENEKTNWVPEHLKHGRFKNIVENAPDWTISRNRFWASPLPIWKEKGPSTTLGTSGPRLMVIGSVEELKQKVKKSGNRYFVMRHGESENNVSRIVSNASNHYALTERGRAQVARAAKEFSAGTPARIYSSPVLRARETAEHMAEALGFPNENIVFDERLTELDMGELSGKSLDTLLEMIACTSYEEKLPGGESYLDARRRFGNFVDELERTHRDEVILIVTHGIGLECLEVITRGLSREESTRFIHRSVVQNAEVREYAYMPLPYNFNYELDLHRPYTDHLVLLDEEGGEYERISEVVDCWVESGSMPFAQFHKLGDKLQKPPAADFIAEYIAQTRTWFYYMHAMSTLLWNRLAFKNVVSTGTILAADGSKMSKSKGNYTDPMNLMERYGADALRFALMASVVMQGEDLNFRDEDVREAHNRIVGIFWNSYKFFELYKDEYAGKHEAKKSPHALDRWILVRLSTLIGEMTAALDAHDLPLACRPLRLFVDDYSTWYLRRSRDRVKGDNAEDKQFCLATQREVLLTLSKLLAPIMPFIAESVCRAVAGEGSVHLEAWPESSKGLFGKFFGSSEDALLKDMEMVRTLASLGLQARERAGLKIRQPLSLLKVRSLPKTLGLAQILTEEVNVKKVVEETGLPEEVWLDTEVTPGLREEGLVREWVRAIQQWRKETGLSITDRPSRALRVPASEKALAEKYRAQIMREAGLSELNVEENA